MALSSMTAGFLLGIHILLSRLIEFVPNFVGKRNITVRTAIASVITAAVFVALSLAVVELDGCENTTFSSSSLASRLAVGKSAQFQTLPGFRCNEAQYCARCKNHIPS